MNSAVNVVFFPIGVDQPIAPDEPLPPLPERDRNRDASRNAGGLLSSGFRIFAECGRPGFRSACPRQPDSPRLEWRL